MDARLPICSPVLDIFAGFSCCVRLFPDMGRYKWSFQTKGLTVFLGHVSFLVCHFIHSCHLIFIWCFNMFRMTRLSVFVTSTSTSVIKHHFALSPLSLALSLSRSLSLSLFYSMSVLIGWSSVKPFCPWASAVTGLCLLISPVNDHNTTSVHDVLCSPTINRTTEIEH